VTPRGAALAVALSAAAAVGAAIGAGAGAPAAAGADASDEVRLLELDDGVFRHVSSITFEGRPLDSNGLVIEDPDGAVVIDTPWTEAQARELIAWVEARTGRPPRLLIVTHAHEDRAGGLPAFRAAGIPSVGHALTAHLLASGGRRGPDVRFEDALDVHLSDETLALRHFGAGHSPDNLVVWLARRRILFGGCAIKSAGATSLGNIADADLDAWPGTLARCAAAFPSPLIVVPGHGAPGDRMLLAHTRDLVEAAAAGGSPGPRGER
jgi:metallo-beta-lactamase class B